MISTSVHVTLFVPSLGAGGVATVMFAIAKGLADRGFTVDLLVINARGELTGSVPDTVRLIDLGSCTLVTALPALVVGHEPVEDRRAPAFRHLDVDELVAMRDHRGLFFPCPLAKRRHMIDPGERQPGRSGWRGAVNGEGRVTA